MLSQYDALLSGAWRTVSNDDLKRLPGLRQISTHFCNPRPLQFFVSIFAIDRYVVARPRLHLIGAASRWDASVWPRRRGGTDDKNLALAAWPRRRGVG